MAGPKSIKNAKVALIQFCLSAPKTDIDNQVSENLPLGCY